MVLKFCCCNVDVQILQAKFNPSNYLSLILQFQCMFRPKPVLLYSLWLFFTSWHSQENIFGQLGFIRSETTIDWSTSEGNADPLHRLAWLWGSFKDPGPASVALTHEKRAKWNSRKQDLQHVSIKTYRPRIVKVSQNLSISYKVLYVFLVSNWHIRSKLFLFPC